MVLAIGVVIDNIIGYIKDPEYKYLAAGGAVGAAGGALVAGAVLSGPVGWVALAFVGVGAAVGGGVAVKASRSKKLKAVMGSNPRLTRFHSFVCVCGAVTPSLPCVIR